MNDIYAQLLNRGGSREVVNTGVTVVTSTTKSKSSTVVKSHYEFKGSTTILKTSMNLLDARQTTIELSKIEIIRTTNIKEVSIAIRFLSKDDVMLFTETDVKLLTMSDTKLLTSLGIDII